MGMRQHVLCVHKPDRLPVTILNRNQNDHRRVHLPVASDAKANYHDLVERIKSARAALHDATDPERHTAILDELGAATRELADLILRQEGRLKSPME